MHTALDEDHDIPLSAKHSQVCHFVVVCVYVCGMGWDGMGLDGREGGTHFLVLCLAKVA